MVLKDLNLGFAEKFVNSWMSKSKYFPSKIGGKPSFLVLNPVLGPEQLLCPKCKKIMRFLLQIYAPIDSNDQAFHRQLFVFACGQSEQCSNQFSVFRCQLPRDNLFYSYDPPNYEEDSEDYDPNPKKFGVTLCLVCGINATKRCSQCMKAQYCSREHQIIHWKKGGHKEVCQKGNSENLDQNDDPLKYENIIFPEFEIIEGESCSDDEPENDDDVSESEMKKYQEYLHKNKPSFQNENIESYVEKNDDQEEQKVFDYFKKAANHGEVIRYCSGWYESLDQTDPTEKILWISNKNRFSNLEKHVPQCENCGSPRRFEFQIMPNLLNKILVTNRNDLLDWGTLLVFTCPRSCIKQLPNEKNVLDFYYSEFIYNQSIC